MNVLVIGGGGREHAIAWKLSQSKKVEKVYCAPGNPGMTGIEIVAISDIVELAEFAENNAIDLTVVGPEIPLCEGIVDVFYKRNLCIFGPTKEAAQLEGSKTYAKNFMLKYGIPTAHGETFTDADSAIKFINDSETMMVVKADGLAAGKGVIVAESKQEAIAAVKECLDGRFGTAGKQVLLEECLIGEEASILALCDGKTIVPLVSSQDHKRLLEGDLGPNTGGMGAYSPAPVVTEKLAKIINDQVLLPFLDGVQGEELDFRGLIYAGVMITASGPKVLEFNVRFGDPETQAVLARLDSDLFDAMQLTAQQRLAEAELAWSDDAAVCVVLASGGYPNSYEKGHEIKGLLEAEKSGGMIFHAGTTLKDGKIVNSGGRVLGVTARGKSIKEAVDNAYKTVDCITWQDSFHRKDIAHRAL